jgi:hypothetical protein
MVRCIQRENAAALDSTDDLWQVLEPLMSTFRHLVVRCERSALNFLAHISQFGEAQFWHFAIEMPGIQIPPASLPTARLYLEKPLAQHVAARQVFEQRCRCIGAM